MGQKNKNRILIVGGTADLTDSIAKQMKVAGFSYEIVAEGNVGIERLHSASPDLVVVTMPMAAGESIALCERIRSESAVAILAVGDSSSDQDCVAVLGAGADDYLCRPFVPRVVEARVQAAIRRAKSPSYRAVGVHEAEHLPSHGVLQVGGIRLDLTTCRVSVDGVTKTLTPNEFRLMAIFLRAPGEVFTREDLRRRVWPDDQHSLHLVEVHIANLRSKIERDPHHPSHIVTVRSRGYKLALPA